jgi:hypothetical protein
MKIETKQENGCLLRDLRGKHGCMEYQQGDLILAEFDCV